MTSRPLRIAWLLFSLAAACAEGFDDLGAFKCAKDGTCPNGYGCVQAVVLVST